MKQDTQIFKKGQTTSLLQNSNEQSIKEQLERSDQEGIKTKLSKGRLSLSTFHQISSQNQTNKQEFLEGRPSSFQSTIQKALPFKRDEEVQKKRLSQSQLNIFSNALNISQIMENRGFFQRQRTFLMFTKDKQQEITNCHSVKKQDTKNNKCATEQYHFEQFRKRGVVLIKDLWGKRYHDEIFKSSVVQEDSEYINKNNRKLDTMQNMISRLDYVCMNQFFNKNNEEDQYFQQLAQNSYIERQDLLEHRQSKSSSLFQRKKMLNLSYSTSKKEDTMDTTVSNQHLIQKNESGSSFFSQPNKKSGDANENECISTMMQNNKTMSQLQSREEKLKNEIKPKTLSKKDLSNFFTQKIESEVSIDNHQKFILNLLSRNQGAPTLKIINSQKRSKFFFEYQPMISGNGNNSILTQKMNQRRNLLNNKSSLTKSYQVNQSKDSIIQQQRIKQGNNQQAKKSFQELIKDCEKYKYESNEVQKVIEKAKSNEGNKIIQEEESDKAGVILEKLKQIVDSQRYSREKELRTPVWKKKKGISLYFGN